MSSVANLIVIMKVVESPQYSRSWSTYDDVGLDEIKFLSSEPSDAPIAQFQRLGHHHDHLKNITFLCSKWVRESSKICLQNYSHSQLERQLLQRHRLERWNMGVLKYFYPVLPIFDFVSPKPQTVCEHSYHLNSCWTFTLNQTYFLKSGRYQ